MGGVPRRHGRSAERLVALLDESLRAHGGLAAREGLELAWIVTGLALNADVSEAGRDLLQQALDQLLGGNQPRAGSSAISVRPASAAASRTSRREIYSVLALTEVARRGLDDRALPAARRAADRLLELQLPDGGWPWLYDAERGDVVERYEVYSVHQHGMAPMTLFELTERLRRRALRVRREPRPAVAVRSQRAGRGHGAARPGDDLPLDQAQASARPGLALLEHGARGRLGRQRKGPGRILEVNRTCRPYELGWLVEAWTGDTAAPPAAEAPYAGVSWARLRRRTRRANGLHGERDSAR